MTYTDAAALLREFVSIRSISADPKNADDMRAAVKFLEYHLVRLGFEVKQINQRNHPPIVIAKRIANPGATTIGIYGHYDVQPEDPIAEWKTQPFTLTKKGGKFYGRGVADNKGHIIQNFAAVENLIRKNQLHNNLVFILEGEEEMGQAANFENCMKLAKKSLGNIDLFMVTDTEMNKKNVPQIFFGLRGIVYFEIKLETGTTDLHSGTFGNRAHNPIQILTALFAEMKDKQGRIMIPGFYDTVRRPTKLEFEMLKKIKRTEAEEMKEAHAYALAPFFSIHPDLSTKIFPSFDLHGIYSGYIAPGAKTVIPHQAMAKFSFRLVEHQNPQKIAELVGKFIQEHMPKGVRYELKMFESAPAFYTDITHPTVQKIAQILSATFKTETQYNRDGGSIPAAEILQRMFAKPMVLTGFTLSDSNMHAPNENFDEDMFFKGITALEHIYAAL